MSIGNFGTYRRMCGFEGGECRSVIHTLREKRMEYQLNKYKEIEENNKIYVTCIEQDSNPIPSC